MEKNEKNMVTKQLERLRRIEACLKHSDKIHLKEIARILEVSEMTVRRDLNSNAAHSFPLEYYGGYIRRGNPIFPNEIDQENEIVTVSHQLIDSKETSNQSPETNNYISSVASNFIEVNDVVFFDNCKLSADIIGSIPDHLEFTGVTASMNTFLALKNKPNCNAILQGGDYHAANDIFVSTSNDVIAPMFFQKMFIFADGVHDQYGITTSDILVSNIMNLVMHRSMKKYLILNKDAMNHIATYKIGDLIDFHYLISNDELPHKLEATCHEARLQVFTSNSN